VHLGCGNGQLTTGLHTNDRYLVHGLDANVANVELAREHIRSLGLYGKVSVEEFDGDRLPYAENLVNLFVSGELGNVSTNEIMRVLAPLGVAYIENEGEWTKTVKPWPAEIDGWAHYMHGADGNAVSQDTVVDTPRRVQWVEGPQWSRNHATPPSIQSMVSAGGRLFTILDEASVAVRFPGKWNLVARDAFNGLELWRRPISDWGDEAWGKSSWTPPTHMVRKIIAATNRVYVTPGFNQPVEALDAVSGETVRVYEQTENASEVLLHEGVLIVSVNEGPQATGSAPPLKKKVMAIQAETGVVLWQTGYDYTGIANLPTSAGRITALLLTVGGGTVCFLEEDAVVCLNLLDGVERWRTDRPDSGPATSGTHGTLPSNTCKLMYHDGMVLFAQPINHNKINRQTWNPALEQILMGIDIVTGAELWRRECGVWSYGTQPGLFAAQGLIWTQDKDYALLGLDPASGKQRRRFLTEKIVDTGHHHRCYQNMATEKYLLMGRRDVELVDLATGEIKTNPWIRGECGLGILPCNGLIYAPPNPCGCWLETMVQGFVALAPQTITPADDAGCLEQGVEYDAPQPEENPAEWATYRHDCLRSGSTTSAVPSELSLLWETEIAGTLTAPVIADGKLFVASPDSHQVHALDVVTGTNIWSFTAGGPVDTPPTIYAGMAIFGSADGWAYCLRASDGELVWRFRAGPEDRRVIAFGQLESAWPLHGNVLLQDDIAYLVAGRSSYLDGGLYVYALDPVNGDIVHQSRLDTAEENAQNMVGGGRGIGAGNRGGLSDLLVSDGTSVFLRHLILDPDEGLKRLATFGGAQHLIATGGFLDDTMYNRTQWSINSETDSDLLVFDGIRAYGTKAAGVSINSWATFRPEYNGYPLYATDVVSGAEHWSTNIPVRIQAMVLAGETLLVSGMPDIVPDGDPWGAYEGRYGGLLWVFSAADGTKLAEYELDSPPVWDGMAVANGRLYISKRNGKLVCYGE